MGAFTSIDNFAHFSPYTTLWAWPHQNPLFWSDPFGRGEIGRAIGQALGGGAGVFGGGFGGLVVGGAAGAETGPGDLVIAPASAIFGAALGAYAGYKVGGDIGDALGDGLANFAEKLKWGTNKWGEVTSEPAEPANDDGDNTCEASFASDNATCAGISACRGAEKAANCYSSAMQRYAACRSGTPPGQWPPLNTWNN